MKQESIDRQKESSLTESILGITAFVGTFATTLYIAASEYIANAEPIYRLLSQ